MSLHGPDPAVDPALARDPAPPRAAAQRRRAWLVATSGVALAAGAGLAFWRARPTAPDATTPPWSLSFERPDGSRLAMAPFLGRPLVLNFWATWCPPCVREMPALERFQRDFGPRGWRVVGIAADKAAPVLEFLTRVPVSFDIALAGFAGIELSRELGNAAGGLPFTVVYDGAGRVVQRHSGETRYGQLAAWAAGIS